METLEARQRVAQAWFEALQRRLIAAMESLEDACPLPASGAAPGRFVIEPWRRVDRSGAPGGGGRSATLRGRLFEKMGAHVSTVHGTFAPEFAKQIPGADADPRFWAAGLSVIAHPWNPNVPTAHMNTRFVVTSKAWFGGGADLTPVLDARRRADDPDARLFHERLRAACERHSDVASHDRFKAWCDEYFFLPHRGEPRGIGGIFYDYLDSADAPAFAAGLAFSRDVGEIVRRALCRDRPAQFRHAVERSGARGATRPPRPLRRVQPALRPRHDIRSEDRRQRRFDPVVNAAAGPLALMAARRPPISGRDGIPDKDQEQ